MMASNLQSTMGTAGHLTLESQPVNRQERPFIDRINSAAFHLRNIQASELSGKESVLDLTHKYIRYLSLSAIDCTLEETLSVESKTDKVFEKSAIEVSEPTFEWAYFYYEKGDFKSLSSILKDLTASQKNEFVDKILKKTCLEVDFNKERLKEFLKSDICLFEFPIFYYRVLDYLPKTNNGLLAFQIWEEIGNRDVKIICIERTYTHLRNDKLFDLALTMKGTYYRGDTLKVVMPDFFVFRVECDRLVSVFRETRSTDQDKMKAASLFIENIKPFKAIKNNLFEAIIEKNPDTLKDVIKYAAVDSEIFKEVYEYIVLDLKDVRFLGRTEWVELYPDTTTKIKTYEKLVDRIGRSTEGDGLAMEYLKRIEILKNEVKKKNV